MNQNELKPTLLVRYLANESTAEETKIVEEWIESTRENRRQFDEIRQIWIQTASRQDFEKKLFDTDRGWQRLRSKMDQSDIAGDGGSREKQAVGYTTSRNRLWPALARVAAVLLVASLIGVFAYHNWTPADDDAAEPALREITTAMAQRVNLTLSDGTKVLLNAGSTLRLPEVFVTDKREVFLKGQAYFEVESNPDRPFIIHSGDAQTRVLGTSFSVRAYPDEDEITVAVKEGRVSFGAESMEGNDQVELNENELGLFDRGARRVEARPIDDMGLYLGWVDGYLKFKEEPLGDVAIELERRYGVKISFSDPELKSRSLTALLKSRSIQNVLDVISTSLNIDYKLNENEVVFSNRY